MKSKFTIAFLLLLFCTHYSNAQAILKAYIVKQGGDSVQGYLKLHGNRFGKNIREYLQYEVEFSETKENFKKYKPKDITEFGYYEEGQTVAKRYAPEKVYKEYLFLYIDTDGPLRLYKHIFLREVGNRTVSGFSFYYGKKGQPVIEVEDKYFDHVKKRGPLREYLSDCPLMEKELAEKGLDVWDLASKYNAWYQSNHKS